MSRLLDRPGYGRFWAASAVSMVDSYVTMLALQVLATQVLNASGVQLGPAELGALAAAGLGAVVGTAAVAVLAAVQLLSWVLMGIEGPNELAYRQSITPDRLQGRMNTTIRPLNRGAAVLGAPLGGLVADGATYRTALWIGIGGLAVAGVTLALSPFRYADRGDALGPAASSQRDLTGAPETGVSKTVVSERDETASAS